MDLYDDFGDFELDDLDSDLLGDDDFGDDDDLDDESEDESDDVLGFALAGRARYSRQIRIYRNRYKRYARRADKGKAGSTRRTKNRLERTWRRLKRLWAKLSDRQRSGLKSPKKVRADVIKIYGKVEIPELEDFSIPSAATAAQDDALESADDAEDPADEADGTDTPSSSILSRVNVSTSSDPSSSSSSILSRTQTAPSAPATAPSVSSRRRPLPSGFVRPGLAARPRFQPTPSQEPVAPSTVQVAPAEPVTPMQPTPQEVLEYTRARFGDLGSVSPSSVTLPGGFRMALAQAPVAPPSFTSLAVTAVTEHPIRTVLVLGSVFAVGVAIRSASR